MGRQAVNVLYVVAMNHFGLRLAVNVGIVLVFVAFYFRFLRHS
jgi:hypothetical protein